MMSDAAMLEWVCGITLVLSGLEDWTPLAALLRAKCLEGRAGLWHRAAYEGRTDVCEYLKSKGLLDLINQRAEDEFTPLLGALSQRDGRRSAEREETARWMVDNGAVVNAVASRNFSAFYYACQQMSPSFVEELAGKVAPEHHTMCSHTGRSPMRAAFNNNPHPVAVLRVLILRGVPVRPADFPVSDYSGSLLPRRRELLASLEADLDLNDRTFLGLFLAGGVHAPNATPACTMRTTTATASTKRVRTQRADGSWSDPVMVPCEPHLVVTAAPTIRHGGLLAAARAEENHLPKLRGFRNTEVRIDIAGFLGVRSALDLKRLRAARDVLAALPEDSCPRRTGRTATE